MLDLNQRPPESNPDAKEYTWEEIQGFLSTEDKEEKFTVALAITNILNNSDNSFMHIIEVRNIDAYNLAKTIEEVKRSMEKGEIDSASPWYQELQNRLVRYGLYLSNTKRDIKKVEEEIIRRDNRKPGENA